MPTLQLYERQLKNEAKFDHAASVRAPGIVDYFIASFPRSGNTWMRMLVASYFLTVNSYDIQKGLPIHQDDIIPDIHKQEVDRQKFKITSPLLIAKSHAMNSPDHVKRMNYIFRRPEDALTSYYHFFLRYENSRKTVQDMSIDAFCIASLPYWIRHVVYAINHKIKNDMLFISYEFMQKNTLVALACVLADLGIAPFDEQAATEAVAANNFSKAHAKEKKTLSTQHNGECFFRKGKVGSGAEELRPETLSHIQTFSEDVYAQALNLQRQSVARRLALLQGAPA